MVYTIYSGIHHQFSQNLAKVGGLGLPLLAAGFLLVAALSFSSQSRAGQQPVIPAQKPVAISSGSNTSQVPIGNQPAAASTQPSVSPQTAALVPSANSAPTPTVPLSGGRGGGDITPTSGSSGSSTSPLPTIACVDLLSISQVCTVCSLPLTLQPGQKALLASDGTCVATN